ncbi:hypothetical protein V495_02399 [Pseudogymnoascus sp. VKM F-4514 (FW-929)]|nr:hypothetical protein V495_02399 [Pseudogymnoascus sp. VKM F-4514 (FW-929)]KFY51315.1 hypothetical protein V497_09236 [Pseudogymnoascus sp. VKM F-4516 (FW-969)]
MAASNQKIIVVVGATGIQGGSVARTFLNLPNWKVRAVTRDPSSPAGQDLAARGAEVVQADLTDISSLPTAFQDANAIFLNTEFWSVFGVHMAKLMANGGKLEEGLVDPSEAAYQSEVSRAKNAVQTAAKVPTLERLIYSALPSATKMTGGKYHSLHWEAKADTVEYIEREHPELAKKTSFIYLGAYNTNALLSPQLDPSDGKYKYVSALSKDVRMPIIDPKESTGPYVRALIENEQPGIKLLAHDTDSFLTVQEIGDVWTRASGKEVSFVDVSVDFMHQKFGVPMEVLRILPALNEFGYFGSMKIMEPGQLTKKVQTKSYEEWMKERDWKAILETN